MLMAENTENNHTKLPKSLIHLFSIHILRYNGPMHWEPQQSCTPKLDRILRRVENQL